MWITDNSGAWVVCVAMELPKEDFMWYTDTGTTTDQRTPSPEVISLFLSLFCITMSPCSLSFIRFLYIPSHTIPLSRPFICYCVTETKHGSKWLKWQLENLFLALHVHIHLGKFPFTKAKWAQNCIQWIIYILLMSGYEQAIHLCIIIVCSRESNNNSSYGMSNI